MVFGSYFFYFFKCTEKVSRGLIASPGKHYGELSFKKFKMALNPMYRIFFFKLRQKCQNGVSDLGCLVWKAIMAN